MFIFCQIPKASHVPLERYGAEGYCLNKYYGIVSGASQQCTGLLHLLLAGATLQLA